ncbi:NifB/NifX family molybdenum-iron cluster-binding protein [Alkalibaculum sporogenes]|uniref:NifB/NifX family molybdenum-iron cluster-binding protein n=1 Tax=Alkalibaculum sporogenes TaxID=2655001 RepID=UPI00128C4FAA
MVTIIEEEINIEKRKKNKKFLVAVATKDDRIINQHFGHATRFGIYEYNNGSIQEIEKVEVSSFCNGPGECDDAEKKLRAILRAIDKCKFVMIMRIGNHPKSVLEEEGKIVIETYGLIEEEIEKVALSI